MRLLTVFALAEVTMRWKQCNTDELFTDAASDDMTGWFGRLLCSSHVKPSLEDIHISHNSTGLDNQDQDRQGKIYEQDYLINSWRGQARCRAAR